MPPFMPKRKTNIMKCINSLSLTNIPTQFHTDPSLKKPLSNFILQNLLNLDIKISNIHDYANEQEWLTITSKYDTPDDEFKNIKNDCTIFVNLFKEFHLVLDQNIILQFFTKILDTKTKNLQFICYEIKPSVFINFLVKNIHNNRVLSFLFSYLVRRKIDDKIFNRTVDKLKELYEKENNKLRRLIYMQGFMYLSCFRKVEFICFEQKLVKYLNTNVLNQYSKIFNKEFKIIEVKTNFEILKWFPLDTPILDEIWEIYQEEYVQFNK